MKTENKTLITLHIGKFIAHVTFVVCRNCKEKKVFVSSKPWELVPHYCNFGFDVMVEIGKKVFLRYRPAHEIVEELKTGKFKNIAERSGRAQDKEDGGGLETLRVDGYM